MAADLDVYSVTLALSWAAAVAALGLAILWRRLAAGARRLRGHALLPRVAWSAAIGALGLAVVSAASHFREGHRPGSPAALAPGAFLLEHPALVIASAVAAGAILLLGTTRTGAVAGSTLPD